MTAAAAAQRPPVLAPPTPAPPQAPALTAVARPTRLRCPVRPTLLPSFWNWRHSAARSNGSRCGAPRGAPVGRRPGGPPGRTVGNADVGSVTSATCGRQSLFLRGWSGVDIHPFIHWRSHRRLRQLYQRFSRQDSPQGYAIQPAFWINELFLKLEGPAKSRYNTTYTTQNIRPRWEDLISEIFL